ASHFKGHAWQTDNYASTPLEPHSGGRALGIEEHFAAIRNFCLLQVAFQHRPVSAPENLSDMFEYARIHHQLPSEIVCQQGLGDVVGSGTKPAGENQKSVSRKLFIERP